MKNACRGQVWANLKWYLILLKKEQQAKKLSNYIEYMTCHYMSTIGKKGANHCANCRACEIGIINGKRYAVCVAKMFHSVR